MAAVEEIALAGSDGLRLAAKRWSAASAAGGGPRILALHGWLDNASSFDRLAPRLLERLGGTATLVALDFPGHGRSDSRPGPLYFFDHVEAVLEALEALQWPSCHLVGHSLVRPRGLAGTAGPRLRTAPCPPVVPCVARAWAGRQHGGHVCGGEPGARGDADGRRPAQRPVSRATRLTLPAPGCMLSVIS